MNGQTIIEGFEEYIDDTSELSPAQELLLLNKIYRKVLRAKVWEFLKKEFVGVTDGTSTITLPADFAHMIENYGYTDNTLEQGGLKVFVGDDLHPYKVVNWSDRKQYRQDRYTCYIDIVNGNLVFSVTPDAGLAVSYDYVYVPADIALNTSPIFPADFHPMLYHGMAVDDYIIQQFDKAKSYKNENQGMYNELFDQLSLYNSNLVTISM